MFWKFLKSLPAFFLWTLAFLFGMMIYLGDALAFRLLRRFNKTQYVRKGSCQRTGQCCHNIALEMPSFLVHRTGIRRAISAWYRAVFNFHYLGKVNKNWLVFECHYLTKDNTCGIYPYRPKLCREFPLTPMLGHGRLHKGCGFWFVKRSEVGTFRENMARQNHEQERREYTATHPAT